MKTFHLPDVGEGLTEARIEQWHVEVNQQVKEDQPLLTIETEKSLVDIPSPFTGIIKEIHAPTDRIVNVHSPLVTILTKDSSASIAGSLSDDCIQPAVAIFDGDTDDAHEPIQNHNTPLLIGWQQLIHTSIFDDAIIEHWPKDLDRSAFLCWALCQAMKKHMHLNGAWNTKTQTYKIKDQIALGYAIDDDSQILLPILTERELETTQSIRKALNAFKQTKIKKTAQLPTIIASNIGPIAGQYATPNLMPPANIIVAFGRILEKPVVKNSAIIIAKVLPVSLTFNHRICTGAQGARLLADLLDLLQSVPA